MDKIELLWARTRYNKLMLNDSSPSLHLNNITVNASQHVRVLGVYLSSDLSLDKHVSSVSATYFYHFHQLRRIRLSLDTDSAVTLVHAFVMPCVNYCNAIGHIDENQQYKLNRSVAPDRAICSLQTDIISLWRMLSASLVIFRKTQKKHGQSHVIPY